ncbi:MAG: carboxypeptidase-like regulatory domain-containing protein, partial [Candidatus Marinimicrobia bacterium]|nr:carboxypeptidase-like regulatory domain-containing protein [Candidatus Neomarinimicrobiota bacterium]
MGVSFMKVRTFSFITTLFLFVIIVSSTNLYGGVTGKISGRVTDIETGEPLIGVNVILKGTTLGSATNNDGRYAILNVTGG